MTRRPPSEEHEESKIEEERGEHEAAKRLDAVDIGASLLERVHHLDDPERAPRQVQDLFAVSPFARHLRIIDAVDAFELMPMSDLNPLGEIIGIRARDELHLLADRVAAKVADEQLLRAAQPHLDIVVAREVGDAVVGALKKAPERLDEDRMSFEAAAEALCGELMRDLAGEFAVDRHLQEIKNIAIQDQLGATRGATLFVEMLHELGEFFIKEEIFKGIRPAWLDALREVEVADYDSDEAHRSLSRHDAAQDLSYSKPNSSPMTISVHERRLELPSGAIGCIDYSLDGAKGRPIVFLPSAFDLAFSFRHQIQAVAEKGHRAIALELPGHGVGDLIAEERIPARRILKTIREALDALGVLGVEEAIFVGHDHGAKLLRELIAEDESIARGLVVIGTILSGRMPVDPALLFREALSPRFFLLALEERGPIEALLNADVEASLRYLHRGNAAGSIAYEKSDYAFFDELERGVDPGGALLHSDAEFRRYLSAFRRTGFDASLAILRPLSENHQDELKRREGLDVPIAFFLGGDDGQLPRERLEGYRPEELFPRAELRIFEGAGHFPHLEVPRELNRALLDFIERL